MKTKPDLSFLKLFNLSFGFFGVQIAYALQSANISRIFTTLGADPHDLSFFWILPPLMGMIVQPLVGKWSDNTWTRFGRRIPYLFIGSIVAVLVMCLLPNSGNINFEGAFQLFGFTMAWAMVFGLFSLMLLDTSINMAMQPFKMMVGDMVNEKQKGLAYSIQSFLCNAGSLVGYLLPFIFTAVGISSVADTGEIPDSVKWSFYVGAIILILCVIYTTVTVKEMPPHEYAEYHGVKEEEANEKVSMVKLLINAPKTFWTVGLVQFFCWSAFLFMWTYSVAGIAETVFDTPVVEKGGKMILDPESPAYQAAGDWNGVVYAVQAVGAIIWAAVLPMFRNRKFAYSLSLVLGAIGFIATYFIGMEYNIFGFQVEGKYILFIPYLLIGCAWAAMLAIPFTILTNSLSGKHMGTYLGLFNCTICLPQILAAVMGRVILPALPLTERGIAPQTLMLVFAGVFLLIGAVAVFLIKEKRVEE